MSDTTQYPQGYLLHRSLYDALAEVGHLLPWRVSPTHSVAFIVDLEGGRISISPHAGNSTIQISIHDHEGRVVLMEASHQHDRQLRKVYEAALESALSIEKVVEDVATELSDLAEQYRADNTKPDTSGEEGKA